MRKLLGLVLLGLTAAGCGAEGSATAPPSTQEAAAATPEAATTTTAAIVLVTDALTTAAILTTVATPTTTAPTTTTTEASTTSAPIVTTTEATTTTAAAPMEAPIVLAADGANTTAPFHLAGGTYRSTWQTFGDCYYSSHLEPGFLVEVMNASAISQGETYVYDVEPGEYRVNVITGPSPRCRWQITLTPTTSALIVTTTEATTTTAAAPMEAPIVLAADGANTTAPFHLAGGTYRSTWQTFGDCYYSSHLEPGFLVEVMNASAISQGETYVYDVEPGEYRVNVITGPSPRCRWQITLTPA